MDNNQFFCVYIAGEEAALLKAQAEKFGVDTEQYAGQLLSMAIRRDFNSPVSPLLTHLESIETKVTELLNRPSSGITATVPLPLTPTESEPEHLDELQSGIETEALRNFSNTSADSEYSSGEPVDFDYADDEPGEDEVDEAEENDQQKSLLFEAINERIPESDEFELWLNEKIGGRIFDMWLPQIRTKLVMIHRLQPDTPEERQRWHESGLEKPGVIEFVRNTPDDIERVARVIATRWDNYKHPKATTEKQVTPTPAPQVETPANQSRPVGRLAQSLLARVSGKSTEESDPCYDALFSGITQPAIKGAGLWDIAHGKIFLIEDLDVATGKAFYDTQLRRAVSKLVQWGHVRRIERTGQLAAYRVAKPLLKDNPQPSVAVPETPASHLATNVFSATTEPHRSHAPSLAVALTAQVNDNPYYESIAAELINRSREYTVAAKTYPVEKIIEMAHIPRSEESLAIAAINTLHDEGFLKETERMGEKRYNFDMPRRVDLEQYRRATQNAIKLNGDKLPGVPKGEGFTAYDVRRALGASERHHAAICFALASLAQMGLLVNRSKRTVTNTYTVA